MARREREEKFIVSATQRCCGVTNDAVEMIKFSRRARRVEMKSDKKVQSGGAMTRQLGD
jgi:hypothetical protein